MEEYLVSKSLGEHSSSGSFKLNRRRALELVAESLRFEAWRYPRHLLAAAYHATAPEFRASTPRHYYHSFGTKLTETRMPDYHFEFSGQTLEPEELENLGEFLLPGPNQFRYRLALAAHQAMNLPHQKIYLESWEGDRYSRLSLYPKKTIFRRKRRAPWQSRFKGIRMSFWQHYPTRFDSLFSPISVSEDSLRTGLIQSSEWSPIPVYLNSVVRNCPWKAQGSLAYLYRPGKNVPIHFEVEAQSQTDRAFSLLCFIERSCRTLRYVPVAEGLTMPARELSLDRLKGPELPGMTLVVHSRNFRFDASELELAGDGFSPEVEEASTAMVTELMQEVLSALDRPRRLYILENWEVFRSQDLLDLKLFPDPQGELARSFSELRELAEGNQDWSRLVGHEYRAYAREIIAPVVPYTFRKGYRKCSYSPSVCGSWAALMFPREALVINLEGRRQSLCLKHSGEAFCWHPSRPVLALDSTEGLILWDLDRGGKWHQFRPANILFPSFSPCGASFQALELRDGRRYWKQWTCDDFSQTEELEIEGLPLVVGSRLLLSSPPGIVSVRDLDSPSSEVFRFQTPELLWSLRGCSLDGRRAVFKLAHAFYLLDFSNREFSRLPFPGATEVQFTGSSRFLLCRIQGEYRVWDPELSGFLPVGAPGAMVTSSGLVLDTNSEGELKRRPLLSGMEPAGGPLLHTHGSRVFYFNGSESELVHEFHPQEHSVTKSYLAWSTDSGVMMYLFGLGEWRFHSGCHLLGDLVVCPFLGGLHTISPSQGRAVSELERADWIPRPYRNRSREQPDHQVLSSPGGQRSCLVHVWSGERLYHGPWYAAYGNRDFLVCPVPPPGENQGLHFRHRSNPDNSWVAFLGGNFSALHRHQNLLLSSDALSTSCYQLSSSHRLKLRGVLEGIEGSYSPSGDLIATQMRRGLAVYRSSDFKRLGFIYLGPNFNEGWRWLSDRAIQVGERVWKTEPNHTWGSAKMVRARFTGSLAAIPAYRCGVEKVNGQFLFRSLLNGRVLGTLHPFEKDWVFFTPDGRWESSEEGAELLRGTPSKKPTRRLLNSVFKVQQLFGG